MRCMMRWCVLGLAGVLLTGACESSNDPEVHPLVGSWDLTSMTLDGAPEIPADWNDVAVQITFLADGTGWTNMKDYGQPEDANWIGLTWSASGGTLTLQLEGEDPASLGFTVSGITLAIFDTEGQESWIWVYTRNFEPVATRPPGDYLCPGGCPPLPPE